MRLDELLKRANSRWLDNSGPSHEYVLSTRIRLARNVDQVPFPGKLYDEGAATVMTVAAEMARDMKESLEFGDVELFGLSDINSLDRRVMVEKHLMSINQLEPSTTAGLIVNDSELVSVMINEEDHFRIQCLSSGLDLENTLSEANKVDDLLESKVRYAYDGKLGYLTSCPTNVGTGLRASVMMHLAGLVLTNQIGSVINAMHKLGGVVRGFYGEGTEAAGNIFQISNQLTLGQTEQDIIRNLEAMVRQIIKQEHSARQELLRTNRPRMSDRAWRAYGTLSCAHILSWEEASQLLSDVRLGLDMGLIDKVSARTLNTLLISVRPGFIHRLAGGTVSTEQRRIYRAELVRGSFQTDKT